MHSLGSEAPKERLLRIQEALSSVRLEWTFIALDGECPPTILELFSRELPHIDRNSWDERFWWGGVYLNGRQVKGDYSLSPPCRVEYYCPKFEISQAKRYFPAFSKEFVLFEDEAILLAYKPAKLPSMPSREQQHLTFRAFLDEYAGTKVHMPSRIDTSAQGIVAVSKRPAAHDALQKLFERHEIERCYRLEVSACVEWSDRCIEGRIGESALHHVLREVVAHGAGKAARTDFKHIASRPRGSFLPENSDSTLLEARPRTGRTHQIRVHAAAMGLPIIGDNFYGGIAAPELHLVSYRLAFAHPITKEWIDVTLPQSLTPEWAVA